MPDQPFQPLPPSMHELYAHAGGDAVACAGAMLALACGDGQRPILWVRHALLESEVGEPCPSGLTEFGLDPGRVTLVRARDAQSVLQAGLEGARCPGLGAVLIELWGETAAYDPAASRRLTLAARASGVAALLARIAAKPRPSAAETRWLVRAAPSRALAANAPGNPVFDLTLLRARNRQEGQRYLVEWDRDERRLVARTIAAGDPAVLAPARRGDVHPPLSGAVVPVSFDRKGGAGGGSFRKIG